MGKVLKVAVGVVVAGGSLFAAAPAHAGGWVDCKEGYVCMWEDGGEQGDEYVHQNVYGGGLKYDIGWWNGDNEISSIRNNSYVAIRVYDNDDWTGTSICVPAGRTVDTLRNSPWNFDNEAESWKTLPSATC